MYDDTVKIMLFGDDNVEKTSLITKYISGFFLDDLKLTIGVDFYSKTINLDDKKIKLQIWNFGGEERFRFLLHQYCKGADGGLFVFNISDSSSLAHIDDWLSAIRKGVAKKASLPILLVGLLPDDDNLREVSTEEGVKIAKSRNLNGYIECDLKTGKNIEKLLEDLIRMILAAEKVKKEKQPRLSDEEMRILDLESEEGIKLIKQYQEQTNKTALWKGKETIDFVKWLQGENVVRRNQTMIDSINNYLKDLEMDIKSWETKDEIDNLLHSIVRFMSVYGRDYHIEFENFIERISKWQNYDENEYPYSEIIKIIQGDYEYRRQFLRKGRIQFKGREGYPYPYVFKPPSPPDDLALAPRAQLHASPKKKDPEEKIHCQYCGMKLTKEEQFTHSCKKKPKNK